MRIWRLTPDPFARGRGWRRDLGYPEVQLVAIKPPHRIDRYCRRLDERDDVIRLLPLDLQLFFPASGDDLSLGAALLHHSQLAGALSVQLAEPAFLGELVMQLRGSEMLLTLSQRGVRRLLVGLERHI